MIEFAFVIITIAFLIWFKDSIKTAADALEDSSKSYLEDVLVDNAIERQERVLEIQEYKATTGIETFSSHEDLLKAIAHKSRN